MIPPTLRYQVLKQMCPKEVFLDHFYFLIYINDVFNTRNITEYIAHTNDMSIFLTRTNADEMSLCANSVMALLSILMSRNYLIINTQKPKDIFFVHETNRYSNYSPTLNTLKCNFRKKLKP